MILKHDKHGFIACWCCGDFDAPRTKRGLCGDCSKGTETDRNKRLSDRVNKWLDQYEDGPVASVVLGKRRD